MSICQPEFKLVRPPEGTLAGPPVRFLRCICRDDALPGLLSRLSVRCNERGELPISALEACPACADHGGCLIECDLTAPSGPLRNPACPRSGSRCLFRYSIHACFRRRPFPATRPTGADKLWSPTRAREDAVILDGELELQPLALIVGVACKAWIGYPGCGSSLLRPVLPLLSRLRNRAADNVPPRAEPGLCGVPYMSTMANGPILIPTVSITSVSPS